jgi:hypothetical protein
MQIPICSDIDLDIFVFGTDTGNTLIVHLRIRVGYGASTTRKYPDIRVGYEYLFFLFLYNNIVIKS